MIGAGPEPGNFATVRFAVAERSRYQVWRRRIAPFALVLALVLLGTRTCGSETSKVTLRIDAGEAADQISNLEVDIIRVGGDGATVARLERHAGAPSVDLPTQLATGRYRLRFRATLRGGEVRRFDHMIEVDSGETTTTVPIARDLAPR